MKSFFEALQDGFTHVTEINDPELLTTLRSNGVKVDEEGYYVYVFGEHKEYELCIEPIGEEGEYQVSLYKNRVLLTERLPLWTKEERQEQ